MPFPARCSGASSLHEKDLSLQRLFSATHATFCNNIPRDLRGIHSQALLFGGAPCASAVVSRARGGSIAKLEPVRQGCGSTSAMADFDEQPAPDEEDSEALEAVNSFMMPIYNAYRV